ncbi:MAG: class I SAM-dependent methyltransferase [Bacteroidetes bacterium]|nr:class I SAM-dependent methyltransferase [Bacteroidota bacterium]MCW5894706.1 class I SAM-dependent methyltransferase [Bacteroidota bacterium]
MVDHGETYGRHILAKALTGLRIETCVDLGCGGGDDLMVVAAQNPQAALYGVDFGEWNFDRLKARNIRPLSINVEKEKLPFDDNSVDFVIANQFFEHTKEIFWINHEVFRCLKPGGHLFFGTPNILSLHNRILMLFGFHPTQHKLTSAHVRPFSRRDVKAFYHDIGSGFCRIRGFRGSQFYPFPGKAARFFSRLFPGMSFSIFFLIQKTGGYQREFLEWPGRAQLETNFFVGR